MVSILPKKLVFSVFNSALCGNITKRLITCSLSCKYIDDSYLSKRDYWRRRYDWKKQSEFDWLLDAENVSEHVLPMLENIHGETDDIRLNVLDIGCGTSELPLCLLEGSIVPIKMYCVDYAIGALQWQKTLLSNPKAEFGDILSNYWLAMADVCNLPFKDGIFHVIIDKGTSDSLLKSKDDGNELACKMLQECNRLLIQNGILIQITDEDPDIRLPFLQSIGWKNNCSISFKTIVPDTNISSQIQEYFIYTLHFGP